MIINNELKRYNRRSIRLKDYDYSQSGLYFVTICLQSRQCLLGEVWDGQMVLNDVGEMVKSSWEQIHHRYPFLSIDEYVIMPNHFHAIVDIPSEGNLSLSQIISAFKSITTNEYIQGVNKGVWVPFEKRFWQRNYYEHIVRDWLDYCRIVEYIQNNPFRWNTEKIEER